MKTDNDTKTRPNKAGLCGAIALVLIFLSGILFPFAARAANDNDFASQIASQIAKANADYMDKQYLQAEQIYSRLVDRGYKNGHLYYNLGNACFRLGKIGPAILNYLRAKSLIPRDKDLDANLKTAIQETVDRLDEKPPGLLRVILFWLDDFNRVQIAQILILGNLLFWLSMTGWTFIRNGFFDAARKAALIFLCLAAVSAGAKYYVETNNVAGVVLEKTADIKSAPESDNVTLFQLHEGAVVAIVKEAKGWYQIELSDDKKGWVKKESIGA